MDKWINFYASFFDNHHSVEDFVKKCEALSPADSNHVAKIMMHQAQRLVTIADDIPKIKSQRESLQLLFILTCAEHIAKLHDGFTLEGKSRYYVQQFFKNYVSRTDQEIIGQSFIDNAGQHQKQMGLKRAIDVLYNVRCDVIHEGNYWSFSFQDGKTPMANDDPNVNVHIQFKEFRDIVVKGCINAIRDKLQP